MKQLLIVEDDRDLGRGLCIALQEKGRSLLCCTDLKSARAQLVCGVPDLILLDVNLPDGSGLSLLREIKAGGNVPVILLTANDAEPDVVRGLELGADDYITKPFSLAILRARVNAQLRRENREEERILRLGEYLFDFERMEFYIGCTVVELSKTEQKLLRLLVENRGITMSRMTLIDRIWTDGADFVDANALSVTVKRLRSKLQADGRIKTVYGIGYVWVVD